MTIITGSHRAPRITGIDMMRDYYTGMGDAPCLFGAEIEYALCRRHDLMPPSSQENTTFFNTMEQAGWGIRHEPPTSAIEIATPAFAPGDLKALMSHVNQGTQALFQTAVDQGFMLSPFGQFPHIPLEALQVVDLERYQTFFAPPRDDMTEVFRFFNSCMNIQISLGYRDPDHLLRIVRMATALEPVIFLSLDSSCGYSEGKPITHIHNIAQKVKMGVNTGIPDFYYTARTGAEFVDAHIDYTLNHPHVFAAFNDEGHLQKLPTGQWRSFNQLEEQGYGPQNMTNYLQSQSESWRRACNVATIVNDAGEVVNHRAEICAFQNGLLHQRTSAIILGYLIGYDDAFYAQTAALLKRFGVDLQDMGASKSLMEANFNAACYHDNHYHEVAFGHATMKDFVTEFADLIEAAADRHGVYDDIQPLLHIMRAGRPDWLVYRAAMPTLEETVQYLRDFPKMVADHPDMIGGNVCADQLFTSGKTQSKSLVSK